MPPASPGMKIGLFGGSFNPPHEAHRAASLLALKKLGLDRIWWLVTPGNPLKDNKKLPPLGERIANARKLAAHPKIDVTGVEAALGTKYTFDTVTRLRQRRPGVDFVAQGLGRIILGHFAFLGLGRLPVGQIAARDLLAQLTAAARTAGSGPWSAGTRTPRRAGSSARRPRRSRTARAGSGR